MGARVKVMCSAPASSVFKELFRHIRSNHVNFQHMHRQCVPGSTFRPHKLKEPGSRLQLDSWTNVPCCHMTTDWELEPGGHSAWLVVSLLDLSIWVKFSIEQKSSPQLRYKFPAFNCAIFSHCLE